VCIDFNKFSVLLRSRVGWGFVPDLTAWGSYCATQHSPAVFNGLLCDKEEVGRKLEKWGKEMMGKKRSEFIGV